MWIEIDVCCQMGYGRRAVQLLQEYYECKRRSLSEKRSHSMETPSSTAAEVGYASILFTFIALQQCEIICYY